MTPRYRVETITHCQGVELSIPQHFIYEGQYRYLQANSRNEAMFTVEMLNRVSQEVRDAALKAVYRKEAA